jgi:hypothetical protein
VGDAIAVKDRRGDRIEQVIINQSLPPAFAQCWSMMAESDSLLRAYSRVVKDPHFRRNTCPRDEGVRVRSTPRKLLKALRAGNPSGLLGHWFVGRVMYLPSDSVLQEIASAIDQHGLDVFANPSNRARLLLLKREAFTHEAEVRAIFVQQTPEPVRAMIQVPVDPSAVFEEVMFDPRLAPFERIERETVIKSLGYTGVIRTPELYQGILLTVELPRKNKT